jgi:hypothetical protein
MPPQSAADEHVAQTPTLHLYRRHSAAVAADIFYDDADVLATNVAPCGLRGGPAVGLRGLRSVDALEADGEHLAGLDLGGC